MLEGDGVVGRAKGGGVRWSEDEAVSDSNLTVGDSASVEFERSGGGGGATLEGRVWIGETEVG